MSRRVDPRVRLREGGEESIDYDVRVEGQKGTLRTSEAYSNAKTFHTTISKDWTDQDALEGQRLVALQEKSKSNTLVLEGDLEVQSLLAWQEQSELNALQDPTKMSPPSINVQLAPQPRIGHLSSASGELPENEPVRILPSRARLSGSISSGDSGERAPGSMSTDELHGTELIRKLRGKLDSLEKENLCLKSDLQLRPVRWQVIYRVNRQTLDESTQSMTYNYLDEPHWVKGDRGVASLQGNLPVRSVESYQERNSEVVFIVFRTSTVQGSERDDEDPEMVVWSESIHLTSPDLIKAVKNANSHILKSLKGHLRTAIMNTETILPAPYLPFFHYRRILEDYNTNISQGPRREWQLLWQYIFENYGDEYTQVDRCLESGTISRAHIKYLIKHNDILLSKASRHLHGYRAVSQPYQDLDGLRKSGQAGKKPSEDEYDSQTWKVRIRSWKFDGNFQNDEQEILFIIPSGRDEILSIRDLELVPIKYAEPQSVVRLRDRGLQF